MPTETPPDQHVARIALVRDERDVVAAVRHASASGLRIAVRANGRGVMPQDGVLVLDLSRLDDFVVDAAARRVRVGAGVSWSEGLLLAGASAFEVVTADGHLVRADDVHEPELFWALRAGGDDLGVVTSVEFALRPPVAPETRRRLREVKALYDPAGLFLSHP